MRAARATAFAACLVLAAGCGSSSPAAHVPSAARPASSATLAQISRAYRIFFAASSTTAQSQATLQHGERFHAALQAQSTSSYAKSAGARVSSAELLSPDVAQVSFTITSGGATVLPDASGIAVRVDGHWLVAAKTFCALLSLQGDAPAACRDPTVTALPD